MNNRPFIGIDTVVLHPQWGVPMSFHRIARAEHDLANNRSYIVFASYYTQESAENNLEPMTHNTIVLNDATLVDEPTLLQTVIDEPDSLMNGGTIVTGEANTGDEV